MTGYRPLGTGVTRDLLTNAVSGRYTLGSVIGSGGTVAPLVGRYYPIPLIVPRGVTIDRIGTRVFTAVASSVIHLGLYAADSTGMPGARIADFGTVDGATVATPELTISQALQANTLYFLMYLAVGGAPTVGGVRTLSSVFLSTSAADLANGRTMVTGAGGNTSLAATAPALGTAVDAGPAVFVRFA